MRALIRCLPALVVCLLLGACSEPSKIEKAKEPAKPPEPLTGRQAFQRMYTQARGWAPDAQPIEVRSIHLAQVQAGKGQAGAWQAIFVSPSKGKSKTYTYSSVEAHGNLHEGVFAGLEEDWRSGPELPILIAAIKVDSDQAYDIAAEKSRDYIRKHPGMQISYLLQQSNRFPDVTWRVIWGESVSSSDYSVFVDATLSRYLDTAH